VALHPDFIEKITLKKNKLIEITGGFVPVMRAICSYLPVLLADKKIKSIFVP
jgi:hypothetical protein